jgi:hypothetical protein
MLQSMVAAAGRPVPNDAVGGFEICRHSGLAEADGNTDAGNAAAPGGAPEHAGVHCIFCLAGTGYALDALLSSADFHVIINLITPWSFTELRLPALTLNASARPRGPPSVA